MHPLANLSQARISLFCALIVSSTLLCAQPTGAPPADGQKPQHRGPPQEALDACKSLKSGQDCNFTSPRGSVKGSCFAPEGRQLACRPKDAPKDGGQKDGPPPASPKK
nr:hypothetical protein [Rhodoferax sp.]